MPTDGARSDGTLWTDGSKIANQLLRTRLAALADVFNGRVLDLGCGRKPYGPLFAGRVRDWIGLDRAVCSSGQAGADVIGSALAIPFRMASFDVVLCTQVLEHVPAPQLVFQEARRVLKPGGHLILSAPQTNPLHEEPDDYYRFTCHGLRALAEAANLQVVAVTPLGGAIATVAQMMVWHLSFLRRIPLAGVAVSGLVNAAMAWTALKLDVMSIPHGGGATKDTLNWLLLAKSG